MPDLKSSTTWFLAAAVVFALVVPGYLMSQAVGLGQTWETLERQSLEIPGTAESETSARPTPRRSATAGGATATPYSKGSAAPSPSSGGSDVLARAGPPPSVVALVGSDSRSGLDDLDDFGSFDGERADVIVLAIREGDRLGLLSVPRDLYVEDLCHGGRHRISDAFAECGEINGLANLVRELEALIGLEVGHAAVVDLAGFQAVVDAFGGYEICTDHPLRDSKSGLHLDAGCTLADGATTLQWLRSRDTEQLVDDRWEPVPGVSDLTRNARQREFLIDMLHRHAGSNPREILATLRAIAPHVTIDDQMSLTDAAAWAWRFRSAEVVTVEIPVTHHTASDGASVLVPTGDVADLAADIP